VESSKLREPSPTTWCEEGSRSARVGYLDLTKRQGEVLGLLARGLTTPEIGVELHISTRTVRVHVDLLKSKLGTARIRRLPDTFRELTGFDPVELSPVEGRRVVHLDL
jgi:DNA-binding NarL/FixJ family response regulator